MAIGSEQLDEASLEERFAAQKQLVACLISEGKDASEANAKLYELSKALAETAPVYITPTVQERRDDARPPPEQ